MHILPESKQGTVEDRKKDDSETIQSLISEALHVDVEVENVYRLGAFNREEQRTQPVRFSVHNMDGKFFCLI